MDEFTTRRKAKLAAKPKPFDPTPILEALAARGLDPRTTTWADLERIREEMAAEVEHLKRSPDPAS